MFFKYISNGYITAFGDIKRGSLISRSEYTALLDRVNKKPVAPEDYAYMLRADTLEWELVELPPVPEPDPESETYPAWDIRSSTSFAVGDRVTSDGTVYECIKAHNASWTRQPPNAEYWRTV